MSPLKNPASDPITLFSRMIHGWCTPSLSLARVRRSRKYLPVDRNALLLKSAPRSWAAAARAQPGRGRAAGQVGQRPAFPGSGARFLRKRETEPLAATAQLSGECRARERERARQCALGAERRRQRKRKWMFGCDHGATSTRESHMLKAHEPLFRHSMGMLAKLRKMIASSRWNFAKLTQIVIAVIPLTNLYQTRMKGKGMTRVLVSFRNRFIKWRAPAWPSPTWYCW